MLQGKGEGVPHLQKVLSLEGRWRGNERANLAAGLVPEPPPARAQALLHAQQRIAPQHLRRRDALTQVMQIAMLTLLRMLHALTQVMQIAMSMDMQCILSSRVTCAFSTALNL